MNTHASLEALDRRHVWHPFTHHGLWGTASDPIAVIVGAEGNELIDAEGHRYLDAISSLWCNTLGHRVPEIDEAIRAQLDRFAHSTMLGLSNEPAIELAAYLSTLAPGDLERVFYSDSGATAVEIALKIAAQHAKITGREKRTRFLTLDDAYHGDTIGSVSLGYSDFFHRHFAHLVFPVDKMPRDTRKAVDLIHRTGDDLCAVVLEPIMQGAAGMLPQPRGYLRAIADATKEVGALLIADEVATGFWRTGARFACTQEDVVPDLLCVAKGLSAGYLPLAATLARPHVFEPFASGKADGARTLFHGHTYTGNALACAAAIAGTKKLEQLAASGRVAHLIQKLAQLLEPLSAHPKVREVRQRGLMAGIELDAGDPLLRKGNAIAQEARRRGVLLRPLGPVMVLMPPFSFTDDELERTVRVLEESIDATLR